jgi:hypothetical protein
VAEERLGILLTLVAANRLPPHVRTPANHSLCRSERSGSGSHIEVENRLATGLGFTRVVIDNVADLLLLSVDLS